MIIVLSGICFFLGICLLLCIILVQTQAKKLKDARMLLKLMETTDELCGLTNRRQILFRFETEIEKAKRLKAPLSCILLDIDQFKSINDNCGHAAGDNVIQEIAAVLKNDVRLYDLIGRYSSEEFIVILPESEIKDAETIAARIRLKIDGMTFKRIPSSDISKITVSMAVTSLWDSDLTVDSIIRRMDDALYHAKEAGKNQLVIV